MGEKEDWSWYIMYGTEMDNNGQMHAAPPCPVVTGTNLVSNCWKGKIQLRRYPTRILLQEVECDFYAFTRGCHWLCRMRPHETIDEIVDQIFHGRNIRYPAQEAVYEMPAELKNIELTVNVDDEEGDDAET
jgi:hypothetical protein